MFEKSVEDLLKASGADLSKGKGFKELRQFQEYLWDYYGLKPDRVMFSGNSLSAKKLYLLYDVDCRHNVISNLRLLWRRSTCITRVTLYDNTRKCDKACSPIQLHHPLLKIRKGIVVHATVGFSVKNSFRII